MVRNVASLNNSLFKLGTGRSRVVRAVCAAKDIMPSVHENASSLEMAGRFRTKVP